MFCIFDLIYFSYFAFSFLASSYLTDGAWAELVANNTKAASEAEELGDY